MQFHFIAIQEGNMRFVQLIISKLDLNPTTTRDEYEDLLERCFRLGFFSFK